MQGGTHRDPRKLFYSLEGLADRQAVLRSLGSARGGEEVDCQDQGRANGLQGHQQVVT